MNQEGTKELRELFAGQVFDYPKPVSLVKALVSLGSSGEDLVLDFYGGSATTAEAVIEANREDGANRRFVLVQISESIPNDSPAYDAGYRSVSQVSKERIRRVIERAQNADVVDEGSLQIALAWDGSDAVRSEAASDLGFKAFRLARSTFRHWTPPEDADPEALEQQLSLFDEGLIDDADPRHVLYEVLLKEGYSLNSEIETLTIGEATVYRVTDEDADPKGLSSMQGEVDVQTRPLGSSAGEVDSETRRLGSPATEPPSFFLCLDDTIDDAMLDALPLDDETVFICQDAALDDSQKVNLSLQCVLKTL